MKRTRHGSAPPTGAPRTRVSQALALLVCALCLVPVAGAEQKATIGDHEAHYVVFPSMFLSAEIADSYGITRAPNLSLVNLSILNAAGEGTAATVSGTVKNLLGQLSPLAFREIREDRALYYIAEVRHADREVLRFSIAIAPPGHPAHQLEFQQELFQEQ